MAAPTPAVAVLGSLNMDLVVTVDQAPQSGQTVTGDRFFRVPGGKGANQAVAASRAGAPVTMLGSVGTDPYGAEILDLLEASGVVTDHVAQLDTPTGTRGSTPGPSCGDGVMEGEPDRTDPRDPAPRHRRRVDVGDHERHAETDRRTDSAAQTRLQPVRVGVHHGDVRSPGRPLAQSGVALPADRWSSRAAGRDPPDRTHPHLVPALLSHFSAYCPSSLRFLHRKVLLRSVAQKEKS